MARRKENVEYERSSTAKGARFLGKTGFWAGGITGALASAWVSVPAAIVGVVALPFSLPFAAVALGIAAMTTASLSLIGGLTGFAAGGVSGGVLGALAGATKRIFGYGPDQVKQREFNNELARAEALGRTHARQSIGTQMAAMAEQAEQPALPSKIKDILDKGPRGSMTEVAAREPGKAQGLGA